MKRITIPLLLTILFFAVGAAADAPQQLLAAGRVDQAVQNLEEQIHSTPTAEAYNLLCRAQFELDAWDAGIPACEKAVSLSPDNGLYHLWLGRIYGEKADRTNFLKAASLAGKVRTEFERAVQFAPNNCDARIDLAEFYLEAPGDCRRWRRQSARSSRSSPAAESRHGALGQSSHRAENKDTATAEQEYRAAIETSHGGARAWLNLAGFYRQTGRLDQMDQALRTLETAPLDHPAALMDGASMLYRTGRSYSMAIRLVHRYLTSSTEEEWPAFKAHNLLGELLEKQGDRQAAAEEYRAALSMAHTFIRAQDGLDRVAR